MLRKLRDAGGLLLTILFLCACQPLPPLEGEMPVKAEAVDSGAEITAPTWDEIFVIGEEDKSESEFALDGFDQYQEYICQIDAGCTVEDIPGGLYAGDSPRGYRDEAPKLTIVFPLDRDYSELVLRLARAGSETTEVSVDGGEPLLVTAEMLGSRDGRVVGSYDLSLGLLQAGVHSITFAVHDDGIGNGGYLWDALSLRGR
jgi:hypothetical protein